MTTATERADDLRRLAEAHRQAQIRLSSGVVSDVTDAWRLLDVSRLDRTFDPYARALVARTAARRRVSEALGRSFYTAARGASGVTGAVELGRAPIEADAVVTSLRVTGPVTLKRAVARGATADSAVTQAKAATVGALRRHVLDGGRLSVLRSVSSDSYARGYARVSDGRPCAFCAMLVGRGAVYREETAGFLAHDSCGCQPAPFWGVQPAQSAMASRLSDLWASSVSGHSGDDAINAFRRAYEAPASSAAARAA